MAKGKSLLIVDDDQEIRELLKEYLTRAGFEVTTACDGVDMYQQMTQVSPDLIILDIMMPGDDGFSLCQQLRRKSQVPIMMLTAASDEADRVIGLELGADDYIAKPFSPRELMARIKALLRRAEFRQNDPEPLVAGRKIHFANWSLDTRTQFHPGQILDRDTISDVTRGRESLPMERGIDVQISRLRQKLGDNGKGPRIIKTIRGSGYMLIADVRYED
jgi:two-component system OmpR family response regulator